MGPLPGKTTRTLAALAAMLCLSELSPPPARLHLLERSTISSVIDFAPRNGGLPARSEFELQPAEAPHAPPRFPVIDDPAGNLNHFYERLEAVESGKPGAVARILHYGDSPTTADLITGDVRALLQRRFGDAGHGYCLMAKPWAWYQHRGVSLSARGWRIDAANQSTVRDGLYGLGGVSFQGGEGSETVYTLRDATHTRLELDYLAAPGGGTLGVEIDGEWWGEVSTASAEVGAAHAEFVIQAPARSVRIRVLSGQVRVFGVEFTKPGPGVLYDSLGLNGGYISVLARLFNPIHWQQELRHADPALVVINYGTNETAYPLFVDAIMPQQLRVAIGRVRTAAPRASILIMSPMDRGERGQGGAIVSPVLLARLVSAQHAAAVSDGCAFFNTFEAMGGAGSMGRWYKAEPRLVGADLIHPLPAGSRIVGELFYKALIDGYHRYKLRRLRARTGAKGVH